MWSFVDERSLDQAAGRLIVPMRYRTVTVDRPALLQTLAGAPMEFTRNPSQNPIIYLPMPDGTTARFRFEESPIMEPGLAAKYPAFKTYRAQGIDDPTATSRFDWLPSGFHAIILAPSGTVLIDPFAKGNTTGYITYWKKDAANLAQPWECKFKDLNLPPPRTGTGAPPFVTSGTQLRTYRLALACTNEYAVAVGNNTIAGTLAAEVLVMNRVNGVYERDVAIHMSMIANNDLITYAGDNQTCGSCSCDPCNAQNDPYTNDDGDAMLGQNVFNLDRVIQEPNYDIGHVFSTGGGGIAGLGVSCTIDKAMGVTGQMNPVGDPFAIDYVAHEMGHQWGANHTFNGTSGSCGGGNRVAAAAYEPGSAITIMGYAGICDNQNLAAHSIDTFHVKSLEEIVAYSQNGTGNSCAVITPTGNTPPTVTGPGTFTIPKMTPFYLTASATDPNGDMITYDWEEYDLGAETMATPNTDADGQPRPIFRPYSPVPSGTRTFPSLQYILNNANVPPTFINSFLVGELLPAITRTMQFQVVARDNHAGGGGINTTTATVNIDGNSGPFAVTAPNVNLSVQINTPFTVTWDVAGTAGPPVNAANVKISLSTDGGMTFPIVLAANAPNDGSETITIPNTPTQHARVKVEAVGNIFFDVSDVDFAIVVEQPSPTPTATTPPSPSPTPACTPSWSPGPPLPAVGAVRGVGIYFPDNGRFYSMGGRSSDTAGSDFMSPFEYNPTTNTWVTISATFPDTNVNNMACGVLTSGSGPSGTPQIYCVGGSSAGGTTATARVFRYNPATDAIIPLASADDWPGNTAGTILPGGFAVVANKLYIVGGFNINVGSTMQTWQFDPTAPVGSRWLQRMDMPVARSYIPTAAIGGIIYTGGGTSISGTTLTDAADSFKYDPVADTWTSIASIPRATGETRAVVLNNQMLVLGGGRTAPNPSNEVDIYDPPSNTWITGAAFTTARRNFTADSDGTSRIWLGGGYDMTGTTLLNTMEIFSGACGSSSPTPTATVGGTASPTATAAGSASPTATANGSATPTATAGGSPGVSPTPSGSPSPGGSPAQALNLSTRLRVLTDTNVGIGGFIITGTEPKTVVLRGIGPSLTAFGVPNALPDPVLELHGPAGFTTVTNDNWMDGPDHAQIQSLGLAPTNNLESALLATLPPGNYTGILRGNNNGVGVGLVEAYDVSQPANSKLANISTRGFVATGGDIMIAGFILGGNTGQDTVVVRGLGPSLAAFGIPNVLANPMLELRNSSGTLILANDNWMSDPTQAALIMAAGLAPTNNLESAIYETLAPGQYTASLSGVSGGTGTGLVEAYDLSASGPSPSPVGTPTPTATAGGASATPTATAGAPPCTENFDGVTAPALPPGWVPSNPDPGDGVMWVTTTDTPDTPPNNAFIPDQDGISDKVLDRTGVNVTSASATLSFRNNFNLEMSGGAFCDLFVLEVSAPNISGGDFLDITDLHVGGSFVRGGYTVTCPNSPIGGRMGWGGNSGGYIDTVVNLGPNLAGQTVTFRFRLVTDEATAAPGVHIDNLVFTDATCP
jgi:hypothetical protein